ncbi:MAG: hypothetical protein FIA94_07570 [Nitrospirae bacterium]|nr:hypothetical protein [Nitrospirota bacterium]
MMAHTFTIAVVSEELSSILKRVEAAITGSGGEFQGDTSEGAFRGSSALGFIQGEYRAIDGNGLRITIVDKPFIVPYGLIESEIRKYFV